MLGMSSAGESVEAHGALSAEDDRVPVEHHVPLPWHIAQATFLIVDDQPVLHEWSASARDSEHGDHPPPARPPSTPGASHTIDGVLLDLRRPGESWTC